MLTGLNNSYKYNDYFEKRLINLRKRTLIYKE